MTRSVHPAVYSANLVAPMAKWLSANARDDTLLDPCAGLGYRFADIAALAGLKPHGIEISRGYFMLGVTHPCVTRGDATVLPMLDDTIGAACTSFVYPNGMADYFKARDASKRNTYIHRLRERLGDDYEMEPNNMAGLGHVRAGNGATIRRFYEIQGQIIAEVFRVLMPGAPFVVNTKNPPHRQDYTDRSRGQLTAAGFAIVDVAAYPARGLNHGANQSAGKAKHEDLTLALKP